MTQSVSRLGDDPAGLLVGEELAARRVTVHAAGWLVGGPSLAVAAAARCVTSLGAMPARPAG